MLALLSAGIASLAIAAMAPVLDNGFTNFDDGLYVSDNPHIRAGIRMESLRWALTTTRAANWHPLTWLSHMLDWELWGADPRGHHRTGLLLHAANAVLLFLLLDRATGRRGPSAFVAALFAAHPLHVESVAWAAERKDVLSALFWILSTAAYVAYARRGGAARLAAAAALLGLGLLAKPMLVTLPLTLLLLDFWPLGRFEEARAREVFPWRLLAEKTPLLALAAASALATLAAQRAAGAIGPADAYPLATRLANAAVSSVSYLRKAVWPSDLSPFYPYPAGGPPAWKTAAAIAVLAGVTALAIRLRRSRPYLLAGWLFYLVTLTPVLGLVQVGRQAMADRYTYVPLVGIFAMVAWTVADLLRHPRAGAAARRIVPALAVLLLAAAAALSRAQSAVWRDSVSLFEHALAVTDENQVAHNNLALALAERGRTEEAAAHWREAIRIDPAGAKARVNLGGLLADQGRLEEASALLERAAEIDPRSSDARCNLGIVRSRQGRPREAVEALEAALRLDPASARAHNRLGIVLAEAGRIDEALVHFAAAAALEPGNARALLNWGLALASRGRWEEAERRFARAARESPALAEARYNLAMARLELGDLEGARREAEEARRLGFAIPRSLDDALARAGR